MPSIPYDATHRALLSPGDGDSLFLSPTQRDPSSLAALCAECSRLAYVGFDESDDELSRLQKALQAAGLRGLKPFNDNEKNTGTQAFGAICENDDLLVAFRGTQAKKPSDLRTDLRAPMVPWRFGGQAHAGFVAAFSSIESELDTFIQAHLGAHRLIVTGHSLGAALATLAASRWRGATLVTFGSPRVGDAAFVGTIPAGNVQRFVNCCDFVTTVPPEWLLGYVHCGALSYIDENGQRRSDVNAPVSPEERAILDAKFAVAHLLDPADLKDRELADHTPINYIRAFT